MAPVFDENKHTFLGFISLKYPSLLNTWFDPLSNTLFGSFKDLMKKVGACDLVMKIEHATQS